MIQLLNLPSKLVDLHLLHIPSIVFTKVVQILIKKTWLFAQVPLLSKNWKALTAFFAVYSRASATTIKNLKSQPFIAYRLVDFQWPLFLEVFLLIQENLAEKHIIGSTKGVLQGLPLWGKYQSIYRLGELTASVWSGTASLSSQDTVGVHCSSVGVKGGREGRNYPSAALGYPALPAVQSFSH